MLKITGLKLPLDFQEGDLKRAAAKRLRLPERAEAQVRLEKVGGRPEKGGRSLCVRCGGCH